MSNSMLFERNVAGAHVTVCTDLQPLNGEVVEVIPFDPRNGPEVRALRGRVSKTILGQLAGDKMEVDTDTISGLIQAWYESTINAKRYAPDSECSTSIVVNCSPTTPRSVTMRNVEQGNNLPAFECDLKHIGDGPSLDAEHGHGFEIMCALTKEVTLMLIPSPEMPRQIVTDLTVYV